MAECNGSQPSPSTWQLEMFSTLCDFFVHAYKLTVTVLVSLLFALKKAKAAGQNFGNFYCHLSRYHEKAGVLVHVD